MEKHNWAKFTLLSFGLASLVGCGGGGGGSNNDDPGTGGGGGNITPTLDKRILFLNDGVHGTEPWITDGTSDGTKLLKDINLTGSSVGSSNNKVHKLGNKWIFLANNGSIASGKNGYQLWISDGTESGTKLLTGFSRDIRLINSTPIVYKNKLYLSMQAPSEGSKGYELWSTDGTSEGTSILKDICVDSCSSYPNYMTVYKDKLYFQAYTKTSGNELWVSDGTESGTTLFKDFAPRRTINGAIFRGNGIPRDLTVFDGKLFLSANDNSMADTNRKMWVSDGTAAGTKVFDGILPPNSLFPPNPKELFTDSTNLYFWANRDIGSLQFLHVSDGTTAGTKQLNDTDGKTIRANANIGFTSTNSGLFFTNFNLWKIDESTGKPTKMASNINDAKNAVVLNDALYLLANSSTEGKEVFYLPLSADKNTNATAIDINTKAVDTLSLASKQISLQATESNKTQSSNPESLFILNDKVYVIANDGVHGNELWVIDPATKDATLLKDVNSTTDGAGSFDYGAR